MATEINDKELAAILAGLRRLQARGNLSLDMAKAIDDIETNGGKHRRMSAVEIDCLCAKLNAGPAKCKHKGAVTLTTFGGKANRLYCEKCQTIITRA